MIYKVNLISKLPFSIDADSLADAIDVAKNLAGPGYDFEDYRERERWFYISYNGEKEVPAKDFYFFGDTTRPHNTASVIGHLAFSHLGFPSLLYITEQLVPDQCKKRGTPVPTNIVLTFFHEFATQEDFDDFTVGRGMGDQLDDLIRQN